MRKWRVLVAGALAASMMTSTVHAAECVSLIIPVSYTYTESYQEPYQELVTTWEIIGYDRVEQESYNVDVYWDYTWVHTNRYSYFYNGVWNSYLASCNGDWWWNPGGWWENSEGYEVAEPSCNGHGNFYYNGILFTYLGHYNTTTTEYHHTDTYTRDVVRRYADPPGTAVYGWVSRWVTKYRTLYRTVTEIRYEPNNVCVDPT